MDDWPELDALIDELRTANEERWKETDQLRQQFAGLQPLLEVITRQFQELHVDEHLRALNERALAGMGTVELVHAGSGIEYVAALVWPAHVHPASAEEPPAAEGSGGLYRIEVWIGPSLQDGRARIRIAGSKRLEAVLPTSNMRFRTALLSVFRSPQRVTRSEEATTDAGDKPDGGPLDGEAPQEPTEP